MGNSYPDLQVRGIQSQAGFSILFVAVPDTWPLGNEEI
jgi:hypothetical protein